jgi:hypothetical protein
MRLGACSMHGTNEKFVQDFDPENLKERPRRCKIILEWILGK